MFWDVLKRLLKPRHERPPADRGVARAEAVESHHAGRAVTWVEPPENPWGIRVLDVRPVTLTTLLATSDPQVAANAVSYGREDGTGFFGKGPKTSRVIPASLRFPTNRALADGVLFAPQEMEDKWALFHHGGEIICVRSWQRAVYAIAQVHQHSDHVEITQIRGVFTSDDEEPQFTVRVLDYLLRTHSLGMAFPAPIPMDLARRPNDAAVWCMSMFGDHAQFATASPFEAPPPDRPLRAYSLLHLAVAQGNKSAIELHLAAGMPINLLAADGLSPLHWALVQPDLEVLALLLRHGASVDAQSDTGATPLMNAVEHGRTDKVTWLLDHGADVDACDLRGFTALHRAAEMGRLELVRMLLDRGAFPGPEASSHTPRSLAQLRGHHEIVAAIDRRGGSS